MSFQIHALPEADFAPLFAMSDAELTARAARRVIADAKPGYPCRVSLCDAEVGETVILLNHEHHAHHTPYRSSYAIYVRAEALQAVLKPGEIPEILRDRPISVRGFNRAHDLVAATVVGAASDGGQRLADTIGEMFETADVDELHLHNAAHGCFVARVTRVEQVPQA